MNNKLWNQNRPTNRETENSITEATIIHRGSSGGAGHHSFSNMIHGVIIKSNN